MHYALAVTVLVTLMVSLVAIAAWQEKQRYRERATVATRNIASLLDSHISDVSDKIDAVLQAVDAHCQDQTEHGRLDTTRLNAQLKRHQALLPEVSSLRIVDQDGFVRFGGGIPAGNPISVSDRDLYIHARDNPTSGLMSPAPSCPALASNGCSFLRAA